MFQRNSSAIFLITSFSRFPCKDLNMMFLTLFFLLFIQGFVYSEDDYDKFNGCNDLLQNRPEREDTGDAIPSAEDILARCPTTKEYVDCRIMYFKPEFDPINNLGDYMINKEFLDKICDDNSDLHTAYVKHLSCFKSVADEWNSCKEAASDVVKDYEKSSYAVKDSDIVALDEDHDIESYRAFAEANCLTNAYALTCLGDKVQDTCGTEALGTFVEVFEGSRIGNLFCGKDENPFLKAFVEFLESEEKITESVVIRLMFEVDDDK